MNIKKVVAATLILSSMTAVSASAAEFNDIKGHWAEDVINELADKDIIHGVSDTEFNPDGTVTRAMRKYKIEPKRMRFVHPSYDKVPNMVLIEGMRDGGEELKLLPPLYVYNQDGTYSDEIHKIYGN